MSTTTDPTPQTHSMGHSMKRKEDPRFIRGHGKYLDDFTLPGMVWMSLVHSPYPHARIVKIDKTAALAVPGVIAVLTGEDLAAHNLAWVPTFHGYDKQMVLAVGKVLYQYQEVAGVIATSREIAQDAAELVDVEYGPLDPVTNPYQSREDKIILRDDRENKTNHIYHWEVGKREETDAALAASDVTIKERIVFQRCHPAPLEPCGILADMSPRDGPAHALSHLAGAARAPHRRLAGDRHPGRQDSRHLARHRRRIRQQGSGLSRLRRLGGRVGRARRPGQVGRDAHREPHHRPGSPATTTWTSRSARTKDGQGHRAQGQDGSPTTARSTRPPTHQVSGRACSGFVTGSYDFPTAFTESTRTSPTRPRAASPIAAPSGSPKRLRDRTRDGAARAQAEHGSVRAAPQELRW